MLKGVYIRYDCMDSAVRGHQSSRTLLQVNTVDVLYPWVLSLTALATFQTQYVSHPVTNQNYTLNSTMPSKREDSNLSNLYDIAII